MSVRLHIKYAAICRCGKRITEHALAARAECPKCGRQWRAPEVKKREQEEARRMDRNES